MHTETHHLEGATPGLRAELTVLHFGPRDRGPKAAIHAALHADEVPALLVAQCLRERLAQLEADGRLLGEVRLVPVANPLGLAQRLLGRHEGRFDLRDGLNFNRGYPDLAEAAHARLQTPLGADAGANVATLREALRAAAEAEILRAQTMTEHLKRRLLLNAIDCDVVLDLHCDSEAVVHLYALTPHQPLAEELGAWLGARAVLLALDSGDGPFDEACSRPWVQLQQRLPEHPLPAACFAATVELRGEADVNLAQAGADADALLNFLHRRGFIAGPLPVPPAALCEATPLSGSEPIQAPHAGIVVFEAEPGQALAAGEAVATLVCPSTGRRTVLRTQSAGLLYARIATRWAAAGQRLGKVAGRSLARTGKLLSA
ncbi:succinylglutamate desuccinylase/aspartoacylase family protein [Rubrivivax rivuli]|uniref:Deacylase n=1 Tax=Rubrivivax rivuli TaxID=1862385 RepID=A0A437RF23_9BURK|nr:succinylglutamate desuccinylase/aspartoacylase family protein [Rubrivivax rivuli]RVU45343.1 deacylase [Rubrivivax rivuli]